ncbi:hypothetical protein M501DRAFT_932808 [Patellaria atrata CBS 101060]|uniref:YeeE/YedE family integral membrane protein n=1 Tax=Patellaria atrata CBS 101060 TaxID=1346257 RepID=A0A9P4SDD5_9PEZI|nr:hypothetical protein M501DRAFT_932808 [Patellaria atrata CBS 101060]
MFTPLETTLGAILLHQASSLLLFNNGKILGMSGILRDLLSGGSRTHILFLVGMATSLVFLKIMLPVAIPPNYTTTTTTQGSLVWTLLLGMMIGWGTKKSNGCTSGHMLCGLPRRSGRSFVAVGIFFPFAIATFHLMNPLLQNDVCGSDIACYHPTYPSFGDAVKYITVTITSILASRIAPDICAKGKEGKIIAPYITHAFSGFLFGLGLLISGMSNPVKVQSFFFIVSRSWQHFDPSLGLIIIFGIIPSFLLNEYRGFEKAPRYLPTFSFSSQTIKDVDFSFAVGAAAFGTAWGMSGICPGPATLKAMVQPQWGLGWLTGFIAGTWLSG